MTLLKERLLPPEVQLVHEKALEFFRDKGKVRTHEQSAWTDIKHWPANRREAAKTFRRRRRSKWGKVTG